MCLCLDYLLSFAVEVGLRGRRGWHWQAGSLWPFAFCRHQVSASGRGARDLMWRCRGVPASPHALYMYTCIYRYIYVCSFSYKYIYIYMYIYIYIYLYVQHSPMESTSIYKVDFDFCWAGGEQFLKQNYW